MNNIIVVIFAQGFEEIEAITPVDFLRRAGMEVVTAGINSRTVLGSHNIPVTTDVLLSDINYTPKALILPGGMPGSINLKNDQNVQKLIKNTFASGNLVASICAAAIVLNKAGIITGKKVTAYPTFANELKNCNYTGNRIEQHDNIITGKGPGVSLEFAKTILEYLGKGEEAKKLSEAMFM
jgi:protein deglycase